MWRSRAAAWALAGFDRSIEAILAEMGARGEMPGFALARGRRGAYNILLGAVPKGVVMIRKLKSGSYRLYSMKKDARTGKRRNLGTFKTREDAERHEREVQYFKQHPGRSGRVRGVNA